MTELELIIDLHRNSERQGPGSEQDTLRALACTDLVSRNQLQVADLGCGSGGPTLTLAKHLKGQIHALDLFPEFLEELRVKAQHLGLGDQVITVEKSMDDLPFQQESLDIIWSEGAIYNLGFNNGIKQWRDYLKPGGYLAVSEITWITNSRPAPIESYWQEAYPEIDTAANKIQLLEANGYALTGYFYLSPQSWLNGYYSPQEARFSSFLDKHNHSVLAQKVVKDCQTEIDLYRKYKDYYSYGFYVAKKV